MTINSGSKARDIVFTGVWTPVELDKDRTLVIPLLSHLLCNRWAFFRQSGCCAGARSHLPSLICLKLRVQWF